MYYLFMENIVVDKDKDTIASSVNSYRRRFPQVMNKGDNPMGLISGLKDNKPK